MGVLLTVAVIALAAGGGVAAELRWRDRAAAAARAGLSVSLYTLVPFVIFFNLARLEIDVDVGGGILIGYVALATRLGARLVGRAPDGSAALPPTGALIVCVLVANTGYLGYPLCASLLGFDSLGQAIAYDILVSAPALLLVGFAVGAAFGDRAGEGPRERVIAFFTRNPPLYAAIAALLAPDALAPDALVDASRVAVIALLPIGFFAVGAILAEEAEEGYLTLGSPFRAAGLGRDRPALGGRPWAALPAVAAADRPARPLPAAGGDAVRRQHPARRPRLWPRPAARGPGRSVVDRDRRRGGPGQSRVLGKARLETLPAPGRALRWHARALSGRAIQR